MNLKMWLIKNKGKQNGEKMPVSVERKKILPMKSVPVTKTVIVRN